MSTVSLIQPLVFPTMMSGKTERDDAAWMRTIARVKPGVAIGSAGGGGARSEERGDEDGRCRQPAPERAERAIKQSTR